MKSEKKTNLTAEVETAQTVEVEQASAQPAKVVADKKQKDKKKVDKNKKKPKEKGKLKRKAKETISEIKKVTWPTFGEVCKKTGVVLVVVLVFAVLLFGIDMGLGALVGLLR
ncbi:MAG: preprotein translocase subunit SecE [Clostridia bacterium]|nr:preprotein translocase subunit SecE [Clostridia bacterium]